MNRCWKNKDCWKKISAEVKACRKCRLYRYAQNGVPGEGNAAALIMFIGEAPGKQEDLLGRPFVGRAGKLLDSLLYAIGIRREDVFIANIVKHRPPANRAPQPDEISACTPYLDRQLKIIGPKIIVPLGQHAAKYVLGKIDAEFKSISGMRGQIYQNKTEGLIIPTFHPAAVLYNPAYLSKVKEDFQKIKRLLVGLS